MTRFALSTLIAAVLVGGLWAQTPSGSEIHKRKENQQDRIANGVASGQLTAGETAKIEKQEARLNKEISKDRGANGGTLTDAQKRQVMRQQNRLSKEIYTDKHNVAVQHYGNNEIDKRRENQQDRIADGIKSGQLTASEASRLERQESRINTEVRKDRKVNGGSLTKDQKAAVNRQLNRESTRVYSKKHNSATGPH
jgi:hypothetical protein